MARRPASRSFVLASLRALHLDPERRRSRAPVCRSPWRHIEQPFRNKEAPRGLLTRPRSFRDSYGATPDASRPGAAAPGPFHCGTSGEATTRPSRVRCAGLWPPLTAASLGIGAPTRSLTRTSGATLHTMDARGAVAHLALNKTLYKKSIPTWREIGAEMARNDAKQRYLAVVSRHLGIANF